MPVYGVIATAVIAIILTLPALVKVDIGGAPVPVAFFAVVSIGVDRPLRRLRDPDLPALEGRLDTSRPATGRSAPKYKWMCIVALVEIVITSIVALLPTSNLGVPWNDGFAWKYVNYTILVVPVALIAALDLLARLGEELVHRPEEHHRAGVPGGAGTQDAQLTRAPELIREPERS